MSAFEKCDRIAWSHAVATEHGSKSVLRAQAVTARDGAAQFGTVVGAANDSGTWWEVQLDGASETRVLTRDEIVRVEE